MKILTVSQYYYPEQFRINDICEELVHRGHDVTVLTGLPNYPEGKIYDGYDSYEKRREIINGVKILRCPIIPRKKNAFWLAINYISFAISGLIKSMTIATDFDAIFIYQLSPVLMAIPAIYLKNKLKIPLCLYCCDLWPASIFDVFHDSESLFYKAVKKISVYIYKKPDCIVVKSPSFIQYLIKVCGINSRMITYVPEYAEDVYLSIDLMPLDNGIVDFVFLGNIGKSQNCEIIIKAAEKIKAYKNFRIHFVGDGSSLHHVKALASKIGILDLVVFHGRHPVSEMPKYYKLADICLLTLYSNNAIGETIPAKLTGYMASGRPVVAAISGDAATVIKDADCGYCCDAGDVNGLANNMKYCIEHQTELIKKGLNGRKYFMNHFRKDIVVDELENILKGLVG